MSRLATCFSSASLGILNRWNCSSFSCLNLIRMSSYITWNEIMLILHYQKITAARRAALPSLEIHAHLVSQKFQATLLVETDVIVGTVQDHLVAVLLLRHGD